LKGLYAVLHVSPSTRAQQALFGRAEDGPLATLKPLSTATPRQRARLIQAHRLLYLLVESAIGQLGS